MQCFLYSRVVLYILGVVLPVLPIMRLPSVHMTTFASLKENKLKNSFQKVNRNAVTYKTW